MCRVVFGNGKASALPTSRMAATSRIGTLGFTAMKCPNTFVPSIAPILIMMKCVPNAVDLKGSKHMRYHAHKNAHLQHKFTNTRGGGGEGEGGEYKKSAHIYSLHTQNTHLGATNRLKGRVCINNILRPIVMISSSKWSNAKLDKSSFIPMMLGQKQLSH